MTVALETLQKKTKKALLWMSLSNEPFVVLYALLPFILRNDLGASLFQICLFTALRPVVPIFSFYWSAHLTNRPHLLRANLIGAWAFARLPFVFIPWVGSVWYIILCCALYEFFSKSGVPALIEILNINLPKTVREKTFTSYFVFSFIEGIFLGLVIGSLLSHNHTLFPLLCCVTALVALTSIWIQLQVPIPSHKPKAPPAKKSLIEPWKEVFFLLKTRPDFAHFQIGFMMGGFGLMLIAPCLTLFSVDTLHLTHMEFVTGKSILMGLGIAVSAYQWRKWIASKTVPEITQLILLGFGLFPLILLFSPFATTWFYSAYILYGVVQAGSHILWNLSGTLFAGEEDSSPFSRTNILLLGLRGLVAPALGGIFCKWWGPEPVLVLGALICFAGVFYMRKSYRFLPKKELQNSI